MPVLTAYHAAASDDAGDHSERSFVLTAGGLSVAVRARYSQAVKAAGLVVSGQGPFDRATGEWGETSQEQMRHVDRRQRHTQDPLRPVGG